MRRGNRSKSDEGAARKSTTRRYETLDDIYPPLNQRLSESEALPQIREQHRHIDALLAEKRYREAYEAASALCAFLREQCESTAVLDDLAKQAMGLQQHLVDTNFGQEAAPAAAPPAVATRARPGLPLWPLLVVLLLVAGLLGKRAYDHRGFEATAAGEFRLPTPFSQTHGDTSTGWCGDTRERARGWVLYWQARETHPLGVIQAREVTDAMGEQVGRLIPGATAIRIRSGLSYWPITTKDHGISLIDGQIYNPESVPMHFGMWHCGPKQRMYAFGLWDADGARLQQTVATFTAELRCHD